VRSLATPASAATAAAAAAAVCYGRVRRHSSISIAAAPSLACDIVTVTVSVITLCVASSVRTSENTIGRRWDVSKRGKFGWRKKAF